MISGMEGHDRIVIGINGVDLVRQGPQTVEPRIAVDSVEQEPRFQGDGILVATAVGSRAYTRSYCLPSTSTTFSP
jgi:NAD kinase